MNTHPIEAFVDAWCREHLPPDYSLAWLSSHAPEAAARVKLGILLRRGHPSEERYHRLELSVPIRTLRTMYSDVAFALTWATSQLGDEQEAA